MISERWAAPTAARRVAIEDLLVYQETVFLICLGFVRHYADAQELAQETYLQAQQRLYQLRNPEAAKSWLCRIARNLCLDHVRKERWRCFLGIERIPDVSPEASPEALAAIHEQLREVKAAILRLPVRLREVFVLSVYGELTYSEVAAALSVPIGTVMSRLARARTAIRKEIGKGGPRE